MAEQEIERLRTLMGSERDPDGLAFATLADACRRAGQLDRAAALVSEGTARHPDFASGWVVAGRIHAELEREMDARAAFERVIEIDEENASALLELAELAERRDEIDAALGYYRRARALDHSDPQLLAKIELLESLPADAPDEPMVAAELELEEPVTEMPPTVEPVEAAEEVVPIDSLAPDDPVPESLAATEPPSAPAADEVVPIDSLRPDEPEIPEPDPMTVIEPQTAAPPVEEQVEEIVPIDSLAPDPEPAPTTPEPESAAPAPEPEELDEPDEPALAGEMLTRSMAEVLVRQGLTDAAIDVYEKLVSRDPDDASLRARLAELKGEPAGVGGPGSDEVVSIDSLAPDN